MDQLPKYRLAEAVRRSQLPVTAAHTRRLIAAGRIPAERIGHLWYCSPEAIRAALVPEQAQP